MPVQEAFVSTKRESGISDGDVILSLIAPLDYGTLVTYDEFIEALDAGAERSHCRKDVHLIVNRLSKGALLSDYQKTVVAVRNVGYRVAHPEDHAGIARHRTKKACTQARVATKTLRNTDTSVMSEADKERHRLQCIVNETLLAESRKLRRQQRENQKMFARLTHRVEQLEGDVASLKNGHGQGANP